MTEKESNKTTKTCPCGKEFHRETGMSNLQWGKMKYCPYHREMSHYDCKKSIAGIIMQSEARGELETPVDILKDVASEFKEKDPQVKLTIPKKPNPYIPRKKRVSKNNRRPQESAEEKWEEFQMIGSTLFEDIKSFDRLKAACIFHGASCYKQALIDMGAA